MNSRKNRVMNYPDPFATNGEKDSKEYGLKYARYIESEWLNSGEYAARKNKFEELEALRNNEVDIDKFKAMLNIPKDKAYVSLNWEFTSIIPKFVNVVKDSFPVDMFKIVTKGVDVISRKEREDYRRNLETEMLTKDFTNEMSIATGINFMPEYVPDSQEELDLHMQLEYRQSKEIASEIIINRVLDLNYFREIQNRVAEDLVTNGFGAMRVEADKDYGVLVRRVDGKNMIHSFDPLYTRNKKGAYYFGEIMQMTAAEIYRKSNGEVSKDILQSPAPDRRYTPRDKVNDDDMFTVLYFTFKTSREEVYKRKRNNLIPKERGFQLPESSQSRIVQGTYDVWYEGYYILSSDIVFNYRMMKDMIRPVNDANMVLPPYVVYSLTVPSIVENIKPFAEDVHLTVLKLRHLISKLRPDGYEINVDALMNINMGQGADYKPAEVIEILDQNGYLLYKGSAYDDEQTFTGNVMRAIPGNDGAKLAQLINIYNHNINMCYEVSGVNRVRDGSAPLNGALVGTQQMALSMSNTATKHILEGLLSIKKEVAEVILNRAQQMSLYKEYFSEDIMDYLLEKSRINDYKSLYKYRMDVVVDLKPTSEEKAALDQSVLAAVQSGQITLADRIDIMSIDNLKMAASYLKVTMKKRADEAYMKQKEMEAMKMQMQAQSQMAIEQQKQQSLMIEIQAKAQEVQFKNQADIRLNKEKVEGMIILEQVKHQNKMEELGLQSKITDGLTRYKEDKKDDRTRMQAEQQSQLINQRQRGTDPIPFESMGNMNQYGAPEVQLPEIENINQQTTEGEYGTTEEEGQLV